MTIKNTEGGVRLERRDDILLMGLDRPEKMNAFTPKMFSELTRAFTDLENDETLRAGVFYGCGAHTTAGLELTKFHEGMKQGARASVSPNDESLVDPMGLKRKCTKPVIAAVSGVCYTAGIEIMLACDIVIAADDCRFSQLEPKRGLMAAGGATIRFIERCGWGNGMYHLLTSDEFNASEAYRIGLVQEIVETGKELERAVEIATQIASLAPLAVQATKKSSMSYIENGEAAAIAEFSAIQQRLSLTEDAREGVQSFMERRDGRFQGK